MSLTPETEQRLSLAAKTQHEYHALPEVEQLIADKELVMVVAPTAMGKTFIMREAEKLDREFARVEIFTSRERRPDDDPAMVHLIPHTDEGLNAILDLIEAHRVIQYVIHPTQKKIYGTLAEHHPGTYNLLATLSNTVSYLKTIPFKKHHVIGLVADPETWEQWFISRYPTVSEDRGKRLQEAIRSLEWLLEQPSGEVKWLHNTENEPQKVARELIEIVRHDTKPSEQSRALAVQCLETAKQLTNQGTL